MRQAFASAQRATTPRGRSRAKRPRSGWSSVQRRKLKLLKPLLLRRKRPRRSWRTRSKLRQLNRPAKPSRWLRSLPSRHRRPTLKKSQRRKLPATPPTDAQEVAAEEAPRDTADQPAQEPVGQEVAGEAAEGEEEVVETPDTGGAPGEEAAAEQPEETDQGQSADAPVEGADDVAPPTEGSPEAAEANAEIGQSTEEPAEGAAEDAQG